MDIKNFTSMFNVFILILEIAEQIVEYYEFKKTIIFISIIKLFLRLTIITRKNEY